MTAKTFEEWWEGAFILDEEGRPECGHYEACERAYEGGQHDLRAALLADTDVAGLVERLGRYNPPDRTVDEQRPIAEDIYDARAALESLAAKLAERDAEIAKLQKAWDASFQQAMDNGAKLAAMTARAEAAEKDAATKQAEIDRLMLEYCPDEMTPEQIAEWGRNQVARRDDEHI